MTDTAERPAIRLAYIIVPTVFSIIFSVMGSTLTMSWFMGAKLAHIEDTEADQDRRQQALSERFYQIERADRESAQRMATIEQAQKDGAQRGYDRDTRMARMEDKIDVLLRETRAHR